MTQLGDKPGVTLVLGGARSGKSTFGEKLALESGLRPVYVATARAWDVEMRQRIAQHKARRGERWQTVEVPDALEEALVEHAGPGNALVVDCLTLWLTNLMLAGADCPARFEALLKSFSQLKCPVVLISNEVGLGIVPEKAMGREFRDLAGLLHQKIAAEAHTVYFVAAGLPLKMKG